jgi:hypothetical protein
MGHIDRRLKKDREEAGQGKNGEIVSVVEATTTNVTIEPSTQQSKPPESSQEDCEGCK